MTEPIETLDFWELMAHGVKHDADALALIRGLIGAAHLWDDLIDGDAPWSASQADSAFRFLLVDMPRNAFYRRHQAEITALLATAICNWQAANVLEATEDEADKRIAFICRSDYCNLVIYAAEAIGGAEWARAVSPAIRRCWHDEGYEGYLAALRAEKHAKGN